MTLTLFSRSCWHFETLTLIEKNLCFLQGEGGGKWRGKGGDQISTVLTILMAKSYSNLSFGVGEC